MRTAKDRDSILDDHEKRLKKIEELATMTSVKINPPNNWMEALDDLGPGETIILDADQDLHTSSYSQKLLNECTPTTWRNTLTPDRKTGSIIIGFNSSGLDDAPIRLVMPVSSAKHLAESILELI